MKIENRLEHLDSLRGLASISVVLSHFFIAYGLDVSNKIVNFSPLHFFYDGFAAVSLFFVLSGFVLSLSLNRNPDIRINNFFTKRLFRIMPSYLFVLGLSILLYFNFEVIKTIPQSTNWINEFWTKPLDFYNILKQIIFIQPQNSAKLVFQNWTLNIEMLFSFLIPFLYIIIKKTKLYTFFIFNLVLLVFFNVPIFILHFSLGIILAVHRDYITYNFIKYKNKFRILLILTTIFFFTYRYTVPMYYYYFYRKFNFLNNDNLIWLITGFGSFLLLLYCLSSEFLIKLLNKNFFKLLGKYSYSIYLIHSVVLIYLIPKFILLLNNFKIYNKYIVLSFALIILLFTTFVFSSLLTKLIEIPFVNYGNKLIKKIGI
jgi:peptidoglycan/LPS O-acetylase OafA/YrhL